MRAESSEIDKAYDELLVVARRLAKRRLGENVYEDIRELRAVLKRIPRRHAG